MAVLPVLTDPALLKYVASFQRGVPVAVVPLVRRYRTERPVNVDGFADAEEGMLHAIGEAIVYYNDFETLHTIWRQDDLRGRLLGVLCEAACRFGNLDMLQWLYAQNEAIIEMSRTLLNVQASADAGQLHVLEWLDGNFGVREFLGDMDGTEVVRGGHINVLRWLLQRHLGQFPPATLRIACEQGNLEIVQLLYDPDMPRHSVYHLLTRAAQSGQQRVVEWLSQETNISYPLRLFYGDEHAGESVQQTERLELQPRFEAQRGPDGHWNWAATAQTNSNYELQQQLDGSWRWAETTQNDSATELRQQPDGEWGWSGQFF